MLITASHGLIATCYIFIIMITCWARKAWDEEFYEETVDKLKNLYMFDNGSLVLPNCSCNYIGVLSCILATTSYLLIASLLQLGALCCN